LFGEKYDEEWYLQVLEACSLNSDISRLPAGDGTEIGERGVTLSGGQRARYAALFVIHLHDFLIRLSLARAVYSNRDIIILDDPLSAVDTRVGKHIFEQCLCGLLKNKTRVLVTHQVQYLPLVDLILLLGKDGQQLGLGKYDDLKSQGVLQEKELHPEDENEHAEEGTVATASKGTADALVNRRESDGTLFKAEAREQGVVKTSTYKEYWAADHGWTPLIAVFFMVVTAQVVSIITDWFLSYWVQLDEDERNDDQQVIIYSVLVAFFCIFSFVRSVYFFNAAIRSARHLHDSMFYAVVQTPILFFDTNPVGRILNRFSKDIGLLDDTLANTYFDFVQVRFLLCLVASDSLAELVCDHWCGVLRLHHQPVDFSAHGTDGRLLLLAAMVLPGRGT
jgi:ATP-binding cassette subfamily C (CFTR/MRP) protein 4